MAPAQLHKKRSQGKRSAAVEGAAYTAAVIIQAASSNTFVGLFEEPATVLLLYIIELCMYSSSRFTLSASRPLGEYACIIGGRDGQTKIQACDAVDCSQLVQIELLLRLF